MTPITPFCKAYLASQGIGTPDAPKRKSRAITTKRKEPVVPVVPMYERGDVE